MTYHEGQLFNFQSERWTVQHNSSLFKNNQTTPAAPLAVVCHQICSEGKNHCQFSLIKDDPRSLHLLLTFAALLIT